MRFDRLDLNLLVALEVLLAECSVTAAARRLNLSQPAVTAALNKLRDYFADDLLVKHGRQMRLTPRAEQLSVPVTQALSLIRSEITQPGDFAPATSRRRFIIVASDYVCTILLAEVLAQISQSAPNVSFEIYPPSSEMVDRFERCEVDLFITVQQFGCPGHPRETLFFDEDVVVSWREAQFPETISRDDYLAARHVGVAFGSDRRPALSEWHLDQLEPRRNIELTVPSFSAVAQSVVGTQRLAVMHRKLAEHFLDLYPIRIHPMPIAVPVVEEILQWNRMRDRDTGIGWLRGSVREMIEVKGLHHVVPSSD